MGRSILSSEALRSVFVFQVDPLHAVAPKAPPKLKTSRLSTRIGSTGKRDLLSQTLCIAALGARARSKRQLRRKKQIAKELTR